MLQTDFSVFQKQRVVVRRRFTDFVYLWKMLSRENPASAVPPLPDKHKMGSSHLKGLGLVSVVGMVL